MLDCVGADEKCLCVSDPSVAAYLPIVQSSLPRILNAAAPPGGAARENRKQCLKVNGVYGRGLWMGATGRVPGFPIDRLLSGRG